MKVALDRSEDFSRVLVLQSHDTEVAFDTEWNGNQQMILNFRVTGINLYFKTGLQMTCLEGVSEKAGDPARKLLSYFWQQVMKA